MGCGDSGELTVDSVKEEREETIAEGTACEFVLISTDIAHRLNHYRICTPENDKEEAKRVKALQKALDDCFEQCDEDCPDENGGKTQANLDCVSTCKGN